MTCWLKGIAVAAILGFGAIPQLDIAAHAEPGVFDDRIVFGQSAAFDGPAAALGLGMREGILASFNETNVTGGVNGRRLELVSYDDGYEPEKAIANTKHLINDERGVRADRRGGYARRRTLHSRSPPKRACRLSGRSRAPPSCATRLSAT